MTARTRPPGRQRWLTAGLAALVLASGPTAAPATETTNFRATYAITLGGTVIGHASAESKFTGSTYTAAIKGSTSGVSRMVTDATAALSGSGRIAGKRILPSSFELETDENGFGTHVRMAMRSGRVTDVVAVPSLSRAPDRIPVTQSHKTDVVDPLSAFMVPMDRPGAPPGRLACNRRIKVFDGWTRFDVQLSFKGMKAVDGGKDTYAGQVVVCAARFIPVAGHRLGGDTLGTLIDNDRVEVWLVPIDKTALLVPFRIIIGTRWGDLVVYATRFKASATEQRAALD
ncbi:MAG TPA: DUF3108 domain-containing protein [Bauldia sp.]|nr:DUF3108 domain-containing protein [Bauldia sp.]